MKVLLDTHALIWYCEGDNQLSSNARMAIEDERNERFVSHASVWEIAIKSSLGKLDLQIPFEDLFPDVLHTNGFIPLVQDFQHYRKLLHLPQFHRDPFDRLIIAQAQSDGLTIITRDPDFSAYGVSLLW